MRVGVIGLGNMGKPIAHKFYNSQCSLIVYDIDPLVRQEFKKIGVFVANSIQELTAKSEVVWVMVPSSALDEVLNDLCECMAKKAVIIDGGNSFFKDTIKRAKKVEKRDVILLDCGTSGGLWGAEYGFSMTIGGDYKAYKRVEETFKLLAYNDNAYRHVGPSGAGHYVKMVHNGIEYALFESYSEGFNLLKNNENYKNLDLQSISSVWQNGAIIRSWTLHLIEDILKTNLDFKKISGVIGSNKTGLWAVENAKENNIPVPVIEESLEQRRKTQKQGYGNFANKLVALIRHVMGGHSVDASNCPICAKINKNQ